MPIKNPSNESLVKAVRMGIAACEESFILERGIDRCSTMCSLYIQNPERFDEEMGFTMDDSRGVLGDISLIKKKVDMMRDEAMRLQSKGGLVESVTGKCMMMGFEDADRQDRAIRSSSGDERMGPRPSEVFISNTRKRLRRLEREGEAAMESLVDQNRKMIFMVAKSVSRGVPDLNDEMISIANHQFVESARRTWDPAKGTKFSTYAWRTMRNKCVQHLADSRMIRIPSYQQEMANKMSRGDLDVEAKDIKDPDQRERQRKIRQMVMSSMETHRSIDSMREGDRDIASEASNPEDIIDDIVIEELIADVMRDLPEIKRNLLSIRLGDITHGDQPVAMKEIARRLSEAGLTKSVITRQRVQQMISDLKKDIIRYLRLHDRDMLEELGLSDDAGKILNGVGR